jgi:hypothetical protein
LLAPHTYAVDDGQVKQQLLPAPTANNVRQYISKDPKDTWRSAASRFTPVPVPAEYLRFLAARGYPLSDVELVVTGVKTAEDVHRACSTD